MIENFGRNVRFSPSQRYAPRSDEEVLDILRRHPRQPIRCAGALHSWSRILETDGVLLDMRHFDSVAVVDRGAGKKRAGARVRLGAGCTIKRALDLLEPHGLTLPTVGAITKQTIAGAISTGTHGSGAPGLSHFVEEMRLAGFDPVSGEPAILRLRGGEELLAARCALGALGVILDVVLRASATYRVRERFHPVRSLQEATSPRRKWPLLQFFLLPWKWRYYVYRRKRTPLKGSRFCALLSRGRLFLSVDFAQHALLKWLALPLARLLGDWVTRAFLRLTPICRHRRIDDSHRVLTLRHDLFRHVEMEVFVPEDKLAKAVLLVEALIKLAAGQPAFCPDVEARFPELRGTWTHHYPVSFRYVLPDDALISMASPRAPSDRETWVAISFFNYRAPEHPGFTRFAAAVAACLVSECEARLHWGKYFPQDFREAAKAYFLFDQFETVRRRYDPAGVFWRTSL